jgi:very-short-patch-repair endonuclease
MWRHLRNRQLGGWKFTRQESIGPYIADFVCREKKLVVEIDGATHSTDEELAKDAVRTAFLGRQGYRVIRFANEQVYVNPLGALEEILRALGDGDGQSPPPLYRSR